MKDKKHIEVMIEYYEKHAPWHDECMSYIDNESMEKLLGPIIDEVIPYIAGRDVLEIACGTGNWTGVLAKRARSLVAVDSSRAVLEIAREKIRKHGNIIFKEADAYKLEGITGTYEAAFASDWWSHMPISSIKPFLENLHKNLIPGSRCIFIDMMMREVFENETAHYDADGNRVSLRTLPDGSKFEVVKNFPAKEDLTAIIKDYSDDYLYLEFDSLKRWMISYSIG